MLLPKLIEIFDRELGKLETEISSYQDEKKLWLTPGEISNSAGNLCLHLIGNLNHFIGATLGNTGYVRARDLEFSTKNVAREELLNSIRQTREMVKTTLENLPETELEKTFPLEKHGSKVTTSFMLLHLITHLNYHLGQINYHRRMI